MWRFILFLTFFAANSVCETPEEAAGVKYANKCEVCKVLAMELEARLAETGKTHDVLELGYSVDDVVPKKKKPYKKSELRLLESLDGVCDKIMEYNIHKERKDSTRFAKGMSQTFQTLHGLVNKGVKVELGIPPELWDEPSAEIHELKRQCEDVLEQYEADIEKWYFHKQGVTPLTSYLCSKRVLKGDDDSCLREKGETAEPKEKKPEAIKKDKKKTKDTEKSKKIDENAKEEL